MYFYSHFLQGEAAFKTWEVLYTVVRQVPSNRKREKGAYFNPFLLETSPHL